MKKYYLIVFAALLLSIQTAFAQVSVNQLTGTANVVIPIYSLGRGGVSMPVNLVYTGSGIKPKDVEGTAGMGWNVQTGGQITRQLRGIPDDAKQDQAGNARTGWIYNSTGASDVVNFAIANLGAPNFTAETHDVNYIDAHFNYQLDTEPDIFNVIAPGLSCKLVFDRVNNTFRTIPYMDIKINYVANSLPGDPLDGAITSFTITSDKGVTYLFANPELVVQSAVSGPFGSIGAYFQNTYVQYQSPISFYDSWALTQMTDANGNGVRMVYSPKSARSSTDVVNMYGGAASGGVTTLFQYYINQTVTPQVIDSILTVSKDVTNDYLKFHWVLNPLAGPGYVGTNQTVVSSITGVGKHLGFNYSGVDHVDSASNYRRLFLRSLLDTGASTPVNYHFAYLGETNTGGNYTTTLADSTSTHSDYWGYYRAVTTTLTPSLYVNPTNYNYPRYAIQASSTAGTDYSYNLTTSPGRQADTASVATGSLQTVNYAQGGNTTIIYQSNDYLDVPTNLTVKGGGIRAKQIINYDNITGLRDTTSYLYTDPATGKSSGKPISLPLYAFTIPYTGSATGTALWNYATIRSENDLSPEDHTIMYEYVRLRKSGAGSTLLKYRIPATNWDLFSTPGCSGCYSSEWSPTTNYIARWTNANYGPIANDSYQYDFAPNPNYDFEQGLLLSSTSYVGNTTTKASETLYTYSRTGVPGQITGFTFDNNRSVPPSGGTTVFAYSYAKYFINYGSSEQVASITTNVYDTQGLAQAQSSVVNYTYGITYHKPLTQQATNSDGSVVTTNYKYTKDYAVTTGTGNVNIESLYQLQQLNINAPVESYTTVQRGGGSALTTNASLTLYGKYPALGGAFNYLPAQQFQLVQPTGGSFTPFTVSGSIATKDGNYYGAANYDYYDFTGILQTIDDANKHYQGVYIDYFSNKPAVAIKNAGAGEMTFDDFDSDLTPEWTYTYTPTLPTPAAGGHTGNYIAISGGASQVIAYTLQKNAQAINYIFSTWLKTTANASLTLAISGGGAYSTTQTIASTGGAWKYVQFVLPMSSITTTTFTLTATLSSSATYGFDDILFYPQNAEVSTYSYDPTTHFKVAETNTNGVSSYYTNDQWGRLLLQYDQDKYIVQRKSYVDPTSAPGYVQQDVVTISSVTTSSGVDGLTIAQKQTSLAYYDGLGRSLQTIAKQASPAQNDIIQPVAYDYTGKPEASWLPYAGKSTDVMGSYRSAAISTDQPAFYNQTSQYQIPVNGAPYNQQVFENSPLQRVLSAGMVGTGFQPTGAPLSGGGGTQHFKTIGYRTNNSSDAAVIVWAPDGTYQAANYTYGTLAVTIGTDEDNVQTLTYADIAGRTILKRQVFSGSVNYDTYYVYNNAGIIAFVIPPKAITLMVAASNYSLSQTNIAPLLFAYSYDGRGRLITKKVPGKGAMNIVYDPLNRPVLLQDANLAAAYKWNYIKYDVKGRAISQGIYFDNTHTSQSAMQSYVNGVSYSNWYESKTTSATYWYYTNNVFPTTGITPLAYGYFDDYDLDYNGSANYSYASAGLPNEVGATTAPIQGMPTMTLKSTISNTITAKWLMSVQFYDKNLRAIQAQSNNLLNWTAATTLTDTKTIVPDFIGTPTVSKAVKVTAATTTVLTTPTYDNQRRITAVYQRYNNGAPVHIANYNYNEIGQLVGKALGVGSSTADLTLSTGQSVGSTDAVTATATNSITITPDFVAASGGVFSASIAPVYQQLVDYRYNIRGQLLSINNSKLANNGTNQEDPHALFGMELLYDGTDSSLGNTAQYNGKISAVKWMSRNSSNSMGDERAFQYTYDNVGRYTAANYLRRDSTGTGAFSLTHGWDEGVSGYDENGNIQALHRISSTQGSSYTNTTIDRLKYTYDSNNANQLYSVTDSTGNNTGFGIYTGGSSGGHYTYDVNGNMLNDPYKNMTTSYNILNRSDEIDFAATAGKKIQYVYGVDGTLLQKLANDGTTLVTTTYLEGFVYVNSVLSYFPIPEGRVTNNGGVLTNEYIITDQQGNARITFNNTASVNGAKVIQENSYYGFGMVMPGSTVGTPVPPNKNLYNGGSEIQNDFGILPDLMQTFFRNYDATLGRWTGIDPQTESAESLTVYNYSGNNPIMFNDPMGNSYAAPGHSREQFAKDFPFGEYEANSFDESSGGAAGFSSNQNWYDSYMNGLSGTDPWAAWNIGTSIGVRPTMGDIAPGTGMNYLIGTDGKTVQQSNGGDENTYQETIVDNTLHSNEPGYSWTQLQESNHNISELSYLLITNQINANQGGGGATVYVETDGMFGHTYIEVNNTVFSFGRYAGGSSPPLGIMDPVGPGVLQKGTHQLAVDKMKKSPTLIYQFPLADANKIFGYLNGIYNSGTPNTGKNGGMVTGMTYTLLGPNCTTLVIGALQVGGVNIPNLVSPSQFREWEGNQNLFMPAH